MIVLHGSWCPHADARHGGRFLLWAETQPATPRRGRPARLSATAPRPHPGQISAAQVRAAWRHLAPGVALPRDESHAVVWLPSSQGHPWPAPELHLAEGDTRHGDAILAAWDVAAVEASAFEALALLATVPEGPLPGLSEVTLGSDLRYWSLAAKLALELLARQQYLPGVLPGGGEHFLAAWVPWLDGPGSAARVARLARAMPPACRAMIHHSQPTGRDRVTPANLATSAALLDGFLASTVDGAVRHWARRTGAGGASRRRHVTRQWCDLLVARAGPGGVPPALGGASYDQQTLHEQYRRWMAALAAGGEGAFRICLRLEEPVADGEEGAATGRDEEWTLRYFLQANDDPSLLVPAEAVWREAGGTLRYLNRRFDEPQERLLRALGEAARVFPALERGLRVARPAACSLSTEEAYAFLRDAAPILERAGYGLLVPPWWSQRSARLGLRLHVSPPRDGDGHPQPGVAGAVRLAALAGPRADEPGRIPAPRQPEGAPGAGAWAVGGAARRADRGPAALLARARPEDPGHPARGALSGSGRAGGWGRWAPSPYGGRGRRRARRALGPAHGARAFHPSAPTGQLSGPAAPLPGERGIVAGLPAALGTGRLPRRRHGPGQDYPGAGAAPGQPGAGAA